MKISTEYIRLIQALTEHRFTEDQIQLILPAVENAGFQVGQPPQLRLCFAESITLPQKPSLKRGAVWPQIRNVMQTLQSAEDYDSEKGLMLGDIVDELNKQYPEREWKTINVYQCLFSKMKAGDVINPTKKRYSLPTYAGTIDSAAGETLLQADHQTEDN
jgi:hypothetical protein